jgi:lipopolysaccharide transport system ATP-binding protein
MSATVVQVEHLGKRFRISGTQPRYRALRDSVADVFTAPFRRARAVLQGRAVEGSDQEFWALDDVNFEVRRGEVVGILGHNGAGKSTLLKLLARITPPTKGKITLDGRVGSLLEVGTGFHPELSGRDNIYLNGAILGMRRAEIGRKLGDIVQFAEVEQFLDTPVKHYSSGMYMRLAFAVAAHMEPEILIVDEVLAVGDVAFQKKCLGKMEEVSRQGRTVLFVSHNMPAVRALCQRCLLLKKGRVVMDGRASAVISHYQKESAGAEIGANTAVGNPRLRRGSGDARFTHVSVEDGEGRQRFEFNTGESVRFRCRYQVFKPIRTLYFFLIIHSPDAAVTSVRQKINGDGLSAGHTGEVMVELPDLPLRPNEYRLEIYLNDDRLYPFDTLDGMIGPLIVSTDKSLDELGFNPSDPGGSISIPSALVSSS